MINFHEVPFFVGSFCYLFICIIGTLLKLKLSFLSDAFVSNCTIQIIVP